MLRAPGSSGALVSAPRISVRVPASHSDPLGRDVFSVEAPGIIVLLRLERAGRRVLGTAFSGGALVFAPLISVVVPAVFPLEAGARRLREEGG